jgi:hypothetical protein
MRELLDDDLTMYPPNKWKVRGRGTEQGVERVGGGGEGPERGRTKGRARGLLCTMLPGQTSPKERFAQEAARTLHPIGSSAWHMSVHILGWRHTARSVILACTRARAATPNPCLFLPSCPMRPACQQPHPNRIRGGTTLTRSILSASGTAGPLPTCQTLQRAQRATHGCR